MLQSSPFFYPINMQYSSNCMGGNFQDYSLIQDIEADFLADFSKDSNSFHN